MKSDLEKWAESLTEKVYNEWKNNIFFGNPALLYFLHQ